MIPGLGRTGFGRYNCPASMLVGGFNPSEKYESQFGLLFPNYEKIKFMFQTTNQNVMNPT
jgi:hypothetical protein